MINSESFQPIEVPRLPVEPNPEYDQTAAVSFDGLAGKALAKHIDEISAAIRSGGTDQNGNDRLVAVVSRTDKFSIDLALTVGFRTAEIDNERQLIGLELVSEHDRTRPVRIDTNLEIIPT